MFQITRPVRGLAHPGVSLVDDSPARIAETGATGERSPVIAERRRMPGTSALVVEARSPQGGPRWVCTRCTSGHPGDPGRPVAGGERRRNRLDTSGRSPKLLFVVIDRRSGGEDVDDPGQDHDEHAERDDRLERHQELCPAGQRHSVRRAECDHVGKGHV